MATKTAQVIIEVDDKSLVELNDEIKQLETSVSKLKVGTAEWVKQNQKLGQLKTQFQTATREAQKLQNVISSNDQTSISGGIRSVAKLGAGLVGTFATVSGSMKLLGVNSEAFDEMTAKATTLMSIMGGLNQISELFGKDTLTNLKGIGKGFTSLVGTVKTASTGMKTALISTGIGALVVGVGLLIANFDKIAKLFDRTNAKQQKAAEEAYKIAQGQAKLSQETYNTEVKRIEIYKNRAELFGEIKNLAQAEYELAQAKSKQIDDQIEEEKAYRRTLETGTEKSLKMSKEEIESQKKISDAKKQGLLHELAIAYAAENNAKLYVSVAEKIEKINDAIKDNQNRLTVLNAQNNKQREIYETQLQILNDQVEAIQKAAKYVNLGGIETTKLTKEQQQQVDELNAQIEAMRIQEEERRKQLTVEFNLLAAQRDEKLALDEITSKYKEIRDGLLKEAGEIKNVNKGYEDRVKLFENQKKEYDELVKKKSQLNNFDERGEGLLYQQNKDLEDQLLNMNELFAQSAAMINMQLEGKKYDEDKIDAAAKELTFFKQIADAQVEKLKNEELGLENRKKDLLAQKQELIELNGIAEIKKRTIEFDIQNLKNDFEKAKNDEERKEILEKVVSKENELNDVNQQIVENKTTILGLDTDIASTDNDILSTNQEIDVTTQSVLDKNKELADTIEQQSRTYAQLQDFLKKYGEEIQVTQQALSQSIEFIASLQERKAKKAQERIDEYQQQLDDLTKAEEDNQQNLLDLEEELKDANGERYDELLAQIETAKQADIQAKSDVDAKQKQIDDEDKKRREAEYKAAKWRKAQAIIDAVIQGALAVVKALPNVFLAVATGVLAAAGVATIAAQKLPPKDFDTGGFTPKSASNKTPVGIVHANEYVAPAFVVNSREGQAHIAALEAQRLRGYADGGFVAPALGNAGQNVIDYDRMAMAFYGAVSNLPKPEVSVVKISQAQNEVTLTKQGAGLNR